jgi:hypothetical protein
MGARWGVGVRDGSQKWYGGESCGKEERGVMIGQLTLSAALGWLGGVGFRCWLPLYFPVTISRIRIKCICSQSGNEKQRHVGRNESR